MPSLFSRLQLGFFLMSMGTRCSQLAIAWWTLEQAHSVALLSIISGGAMAAEVLAKPLLGWMGDKYAKLLLVRVGNGIALLTAMITLALAVWGDFQVAILFGAAIFSGAVIGVRGPLQSSLIPELLAPDKVTFGFRMQAMISSFSLIIGPGAAGILLSLYSIPITLAIDAALILGALLLISRFGVSTSTLAAGGFLVLSIALVKWVPDLRHFMRMPDNALPGAYEILYPLAFPLEEVLARSKTESEEH